MRISDWSSDVCSSDLSRARSAGKALSTALHVPLTIDSRWRELDFGQWDSKAVGDIDSEALGRFWADPDYYPPPGGERWSAFVERVAAGLADLPPRSEEHTSELQSLMRISYAVLCLKK